MLSKTATLLKKRLWHRCFLLNFAKYTFFHRTSPVAASEAIHLKCLLGSWLLLCYIMNFLQFFIFFHKFYISSTISFTCDKRLTVFRNNLLSLTKVRFRFVKFFFVAPATIIFPFFIGFLVFKKQRLFRQGPSSYKHSLRYIYIKHN